MKIELQDAEASAVASPATFAIPPLSERCGLKPGDYAKVIFLAEPGGRFEGERMWVEVEEVLPGAYLGRLANDPMVIEHLAFGDAVRFEPRHVCAAKRIIRC